MIFKRKKEKELESILLEINKIEFELLPLKLEKSLLLSDSAEKKNFFMFIEDFIRATTTLDIRFIKSMNIQDALSILVYHRVYFWDNLEVNETPFITPKDFLYGRDITEENFTFNGVKFKNIATLEDLQKAEKLCIIENKLDLMNLYLLGGFAKTPKSGVTAILTAEDNLNARNFVKSLNDSISMNGDVSLDFLTDFKALHLVTAENYTLSVMDSSFFLHYQKRNIFQF